MTQTSPLCSPVFVLGLRTQEHVLLNMPLAVGTHVWWEIGSSALHILVVSEDKHQGPSPVNVNALRLIVMGKHTKTTKITSCRGLCSTDKILTTGFLGL